MKSPFPPPDPREGSEDSPEPRPHPRAWDPREIQKGPAGPGVPGVRSSWGQLGHRGWLCFPKSPGTFLVRAQIPGATARAPQGHMGDSAKKRANTEASFKPPQNVGVSPHPTPVSPFQLFLQLSWNFNIPLSPGFVLFGSFIFSLSVLQSLPDASKCNWMPSPCEPGIAAGISTNPGTGQNLGA